MFGSGWQFGDAKCPLICYSYNKLKTVKKNLMQIVCYKNTAHIKFAGRMA
jgi:hypothetical protein